jgi:anti-anti-sigma factor
MTTNNVAVIKLISRALDAGALESVGAQVTGIAEAGEQQVYLDLSNVQLVCSLGLGRLIALHNKVQSRGGHLTLFNVNELVFRILDVSRLTQVLDVRRSGPAACVHPR